MPSEEDYKKILTPEQYGVLRKSATEPPFSGKYVDHHEDGRYSCAACGKTLFMSDTKFDSGSGWPSFNDVVSNDAVKLINDNSHNMQRTEVKCSNCGSHLGHFFRDSPDQPTGVRYCINSLALTFDKKPGESS